MSEKSKKTTKTSASKTTTSKKPADVVEAKVDVEVVEMATDDSVKNVSENNDVVEPKNETPEVTEPNEKATKVFGKIAAYNWWNKLGLLNIVWTFGILLLILAFVWKGDDQAKYHANIIFGALVSGFSLIAISLVVTFYYLKKIKSFDKMQEWIAIILSFVPLGFISNFVLGSMESKRFYNNQSVASLGYKKPKLVMPHVYIILLAIIFAVIVASWFVTWKGANPGQQSPAGFLYVLIAPIEGFVNAADLIVFLLIMGGFLAIVTESGALEAGLGRMVKKMHGKEIILVPILFTLFTVGGTTYGMAEETIPFYLLLIPVFLAAGFDAYTAFLVILLGAGLGTAASILNPFVVNTSISAVNGAGNWTGPELTPSIGIAWRSIIYVALLLAGGSYVTWYAWRVKKHPEKSAVYDLRKEHEKQFSFNLDSLPEFTVKRKIILAIFGITFVSMIISVITWEDVASTKAFVHATEWVDKYFPFLGGLSKDGSSLIGAWGTWYLTQMSFLFFLSSIVIGALSWKGSLHFINKFMAGAADFIGVGVVIAISRGISITVSNTGLDSIIVNGLSGMINSIGNAYAVILVFFFVFIALSFLIPSTSGFAGAVFPLIGPAIGVGGTVPGLTISGNIASFSLASGLVNISMPSGGIFMSALSVSNIPLGKYYKATGWFLGVLVALSIVLLMIGVAANNGNNGISALF